MNFPIIDLRQTEFQTRDDPGFLSELATAYGVQERQRNRVPRLLMRLMFSVASRRAPLLRVLTQGGSGTLDGLSTYVMKLRPDQLPSPFDNNIDRKIVASALAVSVRLRMQQLAHLIAEALDAELGAHGGDVHLVDIAGGPAMDAINALLLLDARGRLAGRSILIHVLDPETEGFEFGAKVLAKLSADGAFATARVGFVHRAYDWHAPSDLADFSMQLARNPDTIVAAMSEGGLFEYAPDDVVSSNLAVMRASGMRFVAGSVTRADTLTLRALKQMRFKLYPRGAEGLAPIAHSAGFAIAQVRAALTSDQVLLRPLAVGPA